MQDDQPQGVPDGGGREGHTTELRARPCSPEAVLVRLGRTPFTARYDGADRWLQRTYVRRSQWLIRYRQTDGDRRVHY
ncbi:hypothetical protein NGM37_55640 [Streptomyces sp. TRM76130]|nr:hypothetical protein [Streptomyces sp. TRM76130]